VVHNPSPEAATLGEPSYVWRFGQERRLNLIRRFVPLEGARFLDVGCGIGTYVKRIAELATLSAGVDVSEKRLHQSTVPNLVAGVSERLPFRAGAFDAILLNEVIEHVRDDRETLVECLRVVRPGGHVVIYAPNRLYPFETHGIYVGKRYRFGNIPLVNYLPNALRNRLVPHAKAYTERDMRRLYSGLPASVVVHTYVYPGFDNIVARNPTFGHWLRRVLYRAEQNPARRFGLSHFVVLRRS
jgi:ubiquinone/menaquinone biosynthesis C-methylase UbiE